MANYKITIEATFTNGNNTHDVIGADNDINANAIFDKFVTFVKESDSKINSAYIMLYNCKTRNMINRFVL